MLSNPGVGGVIENPTVEMLVQSLPDDIHTKNFSWSRALFGRYDVLHIHWPEFVIRHPHTAGRLIKQIAFLALCARLFFLKTPTLWTVHNDAPHERGPRAERLLLGLWGRIATRRVYMYESALVEARNPRGVVIPRGDYAPIYESHRRAWRGSVVPGRVLLFGYLRPYKGVEELLAASDGIAGAPISVRVAGEPADLEYSQRLESMVTSEAVTIRWGNLTDAELADEILSAEGVILPYRRMYNSGAALLALTLGRPLIVPRSDTMAELRAEVGAEWVLMYDGAVSSQLLCSDIPGFLAQTRPQRPSFRNRDWSTVGARYAIEYRRLAGAAS